MDRADRAGLSVSVVGHLALFVALSLALVSTQAPRPAIPDAMDVQLTDAVGLRSAAPEPATEAPQEMLAPDAGPAQDAAPPEPAPVPAPTPPAAKPSPEPPREAAPKPAAKPAPPAAAPKTRLSADLLKGLKDPADTRGDGRAGKAEKARGARLGPNFLKGVVNPSAGKGERARASVSGAALNGLAAAIRRQIQPCYELGALGGTPAMEIVTVLDLRFNEDGSVAGTPRLVEQQGVNDGNARYARQMAEVSRSAVLRCAPLRLPAELYQGGWERIEMGFIPRQLQ